MENKEIKDQVGTYYTNKLKEHGNSHWGVDWNSVESQEWRFEQLCKLLPTEEAFSVLDYGCGYGALWPYLNRKGYTLSSFVGYDVSQAMIVNAQKEYSQAPKTRWVNNLEEEQVDYLLASGIFNVRLQRSDAEWQQYILETLHEFDGLTQKGFAFNILTSYSDKEYQRDYLYYADPLFFFDYCKRNFSRNVALLHDYELYEFTLLVKK